MALTAASFLYSCDGQKDYDNYLECLKAQEAAIDTISSEQSYADYVSRYIHLTDSFSRLDMKLDPTQADEVKELCTNISTRINAKYLQLTSRTENTVAEDSATVAN